MADNKVMGNEEVVDFVTEVENTQVATPEKPATATKNIVTGVAIAGGTVLALYGLYELGKKGVKLIKKHMEKKKHPDYEYVKETVVEEAAEEIEKTMKGAEAKVKFRKKEKHPMGFQYRG